MKIVAGTTQDTQGRDSLALGAALARALDAQLVAVNVMPVAFNFPGPAHVDAEWRSFLLGQGRDTLSWARQQLGHPSDVGFELTSHKSSGIGLDEFATEIGAELIVIGSAPGADEGRIELGSTADQLLHGSSSSVAIAPMGYSSWAPERIGRAVVAYQDSSQGRHLLARALRAVRTQPDDVPARLALINVVHRVTKIAGTRLGPHAEDGVIAALAEQAALILAEGAGEVDRDLAGRCEVATEVLVGRDVATALARFDWEDDDLLLVGSTQRGPIKRVLLGDTSYKLIKAATVPVMAVPKSAER